MKNLSLTRSLLILALPLTFLSSCTKDISSYNNVTKAPSAVPPGPLFTYAVKNLCDALADCSGFVNMYRHIVEHWSQAVIQDAAQYNFNIDNTCDTWWTRMYVNVLSNLHASDSIL